MDYKKIIFGVAIFFVLVLIGVLQSVIFRNPTAEIKGQTFKLEVAKTEEQKQIGLSKHEELAKDSGMIFLFEKEGNYTFWMKDMKFPIDIIYIKGDTVVEVFEDQKPITSGTPPIIVPSAPADKVFEINAGLSKEYGIKKGDTIKLSNL